MDSSFCVILIIVGVLISVNGQIPRSPCPDTFDYGYDGQNMYGIIQLVLKNKLSSVEVKVNFTIAAALNQKYLGQLRPEGRTDQLNPGQTLKYRVDFPVQRPLPKLTDLTVNGETLCSAPADYPQPGQFLTKITLLHSLSTVSYNVPYKTNDILPTWAIPVNTFNNYGPVIESDGDFIAYTPPTSTSIRPQNILTNTPATWIYPPRPVTNRVPQTPPSPQPNIESTELSVVAPITAPAGQVPTQYECGRPTVTIPPLIIGGEHFQRGTYPWLVALSKQKKQERQFICGASLVSDQHVVTAAHCQQIRDQKTEVEEFLVTVGAFDLDDLADNEAQSYYVKHATPHNDYDPFTYKNDIMVMTLKRKVVYTDYIIPICLWSEEYADLSKIVGRNGVIAGWGRNEDGTSGSGKPRKAKIPIVSTEECRRSHKDFIKLTSDRTICAGDRNRISPCDGDSGGGLYLRYKGIKGENDNDQPMRLRGVVSVSLENKDEDSLYDCNIQDSVEVKVNFTIAAALNQKYLGKLRPEGRIEQLNPGQTLKYRVHFPVQIPLPKLSNLTVNGESLCNAPDDYPQPDQTLTKITLLHSLRIVSYNKPAWTIPVDTINNYPGVIESDAAFVAYTPPTSTSIRPQNILTNTPATWKYPPRPVTNRVPQTPPSPQPNIENTELSVVAPITEPAGQVPTQYECGRTKVTIIPNVIGGEHFQRGTYPWLVALSKLKKLERKFICGASLVSDQHVVTAAHCQQIRDQKIEVKEFLVTAGAFDLDNLADNEAQSYYVKHAIPHDDYDPFTYKNDIMVMTLKRKVVYTDYIIPICLWSEEYADLSNIVGRNGVIAGWGRNEDGSAGSGKPRRAKIPIVSTEECRSSHIDFVKLTSDRTICAGDRNKTIPCDGDSGGGLYLRYKGIKGENDKDQPMRLRGVFSVSLENKDDDSLYDCNIQEYVVFTDVAKFTPWIRNIMETSR
ncbi:hypothetical protein K1T71_011383 [Dendrolimus kikuchii]|uniref:Uncharacterized protein n=1 Tax=Dendrolimus kikuchii TaxID=765133 RepID=A0ACC1CNT0_9NEOP|nr:hypothetical protein K1T71_011383 [Dendrolimus kikuchii]